MAIVMGGIDIQWQISGFGDTNGYHEKEKTQR